MSSLPPGYFDAVYEANADPWQFETSAYETAKYDDTVAALGERHFARGFEIGCSIGMLTRRLAGLCEQLLSVDVSEVALAAARARCADLVHVAFRRVQVPEEFPEGRFDLVVLSEVGYYWSGADLERALARIVEALEAGGALILVHWTPPVADYPLRGDDVHAAALALAEGNGPLMHRAGWCRETYRLDLLTKR